MDARDTHQHQPLLKSHFGKRHRHQCSAYCAPCYTTEDGQYVHTTLSLLGPRLPEPQATVSTRCPSWLMYTIPDIGSNPNILHPVIDLTNPHFFPTRTTTFPPRILIHPKENIFNIASAGNHPPAQQESATAYLVTADSKEKMDTSSNILTEFHLPPLLQWLNESLGKPTMKGEYMKDHEKRTLPQDAVFIWESLKMMKIQRGNIPTYSKLPQLYIAGTGFFRKVALEHVGAAPSSIAEWAAIFGVDESMARSVIEFSVRFKEVPTYTCKACRSDC